MHGKKPGIAYLNASQAEANISLKLKLIAKALAQAARANVRSSDELDWGASLLRGEVPNSVRQFNLWSMDALPESLRKDAPPFFRNANVTLRRHPALLSSAREAVAAVKSAECAPTRAARREQSIAGLRRRLTASNTMRHIAERELIESRLENQGLKERLAVEVNRRLAVEREAGGAIAKLQEQLLQKAQGSRDERIRLKPI